MEYVGRRVRKGVQGHAALFGLVRAYEPGSGVFEVVYDDGSSEDLDLSGISALLVPTESPASPPSGSAERESGSSPSKRRRIVDTGKDVDNSVIESGVFDNLADRDGDSGKFDLNLNKGLDLNDDAVDKFSGDGRGFEAVGGGTKLKGLDLNEVVDLELDEGCSLNIAVDEGVLTVKKEMIDLNLDVNEKVEDLSDGTARRCFDLNLQCTEDDVANVENCEGQAGGNESVSAEANVEMKVDLVKDDSEAVLADVEPEEGNPVVMESRKPSPSSNCATDVDNGNVAPVIAQRKQRGRKRKDASNNNIEMAASSPGLQNMDVETAETNLELESGKGTPLKDGTNDENGVPETVVKGTRSRKRRAVVENDTTLPTPETGLRRSRRRAKLAALSEPDQVPAAEGLDVINHQLTSPEISVVSEEKITTPAIEKPGDDVTLPPKVELPPSSCDLDLNGVSVFDVVSVYTFLRSFSTLLFLSPFDLGSFVASLKSNDSSLLFDSIHVSLLKTLRRHLESLSNEGVASASNCLRSLNWDFLDLITWPMFLVEYVLLHSPGFVPCSVACQLKHFYDEYYNLSTSAKVDILQHLCDDIIEVEAFKAEMNKRTLATDRHTDLERSFKFESLKKRKAAMDVVSSSCITDEGAEGSLDWNSDECSLCKMDGNLICCDGCPAAFHSRCVGVVSSQLPEGEWYCPECSIEKDRPWLNLGKSIRGADILGSDPYGRVYYSSGGYLLVLEICNDGNSFWSYNRNDIPTLIEALESLPYPYRTIINAICKQWNIVREVGGARNELDTRSLTQSAFCEKSQISEMHLTPLKTLNKNGALAERRSSRKSSMPANSSNGEPENAKRSATAVETGNRGLKMESHLASSEGSAEVSQTFTQSDVVKESGLDYSKKCTEISDHFCTPGKLVNAGDHYTKYTEGVVSQGKDYVNCYTFARIASEFYRELTCKSSDKTSEDAPKSVEEIIVRQLKVLLSRSAEFSSSNRQKLNMNLRKESCGWCYYCRVPEEGKDCLFILNDNIPSVENYTCEILGIHLQKDVKSHLLDVLCHIICIEDHLQGLLSGPWLNPHFPTIWRKSMIGVADIASLKNLLLKMESNLHHLAFSTDWQKHVDAVSTVGSACHIAISSARLSSKHGLGRKRANPSKVETSQTSNAAAGLCLFWWRGGRGSRALFNWKVLPQTLASKAARQGGCKKIPGILYPEIGEYAKRTKSISWRAAVETSRSVHQLALQVRELEANIKWDDIGNNSPLLKMDKDSKKAVRSFKKVIVRRKCSEQGVVKYLLDFGKRRFIPDAVVRHGSIVEDSSTGKKKYWLEESHVPLHLVKSFEEKRIARNSYVVKSGKHRCSIGVTGKSFKRKGFSYLFSRAEELENHQCGHCNKDVPIREAVSCQHCEGFFHEKHVQKSVGSITAEPTYTCHRCQSGKFVKIGGKKRGRKPKSVSLQLKKNASKRQTPLNQGQLRGRGKGKRKQSGSSSNTGKDLVVMPLRRSARNAARLAKLSLKNNKIKKRKRGRKAKSANAIAKKPENVIWKKKRAPSNSSFWSNGLWLSRKPDDARVIHFRSRMLLVMPGDANQVNGSRTCALCGELEYNSELNYVACETCGVWFHGDALSLTADRIDNIIGFKCHRCLNRKPPVCPYQFLNGSNRTELAAEYNSKDECPMEESVVRDELAGVESNARDEFVGEESNCLVHIKDTSKDQRSDANDVAKNVLLKVYKKKQSSLSIPEADHREKD